MYYTFAGYKSHIYREHRDLIDKDLLKQRMQTDMNTDNDEILLSTSYDTQSDFHTQIQDEKDERDEKDDETDDEDAICWPLLMEEIIQSSGKKIDLDFFEKFYVDFLLNLREGHSLPQNIIHTITSGFKSLIELILKLLKMKTKTSLIKHEKQLLIQRQMTLFYWLM
jgi:hypothetical protein